MIVSKVVLVGAISGGALLAAGGAGYGWHEWTHSPKYSLKAVAAAVEHRDRYQFEKYVDADAILHSVVADSSDGNALASAVSGAVIPQLKTQMIKAIEDGTVPADSQIGRGVQKVLSGELPTIERQGRNAYFNVPITTKGGAAFALKIHMTQVPDGYWRIDRIANMKDLHAVEEQEEKARKAAITKENEDELAKLHVSAKLHTSVGEGWEKKNRFQVRFENKSDKTITNMTGRIRLPAQEFDHGIKGKIEIAPGATYNATWEFDVNRFIEDTLRVYALGETDRFDVVIESVRYADGSERTRTTGL